MNLNDLVEQSGEWLKGTGPESDVIVSSRLRLARNVRRFSFPIAANAREKAEIEEYIKERLSKSAPVPDCIYIPLEKLPPIDRDLLVERHLISRDHAMGNGPRGVLVSRDETVSIMVNEEDHLRMQVLRSGFQLDAAWKELNKIDDLLSENIDYAFDPQLGFLTSCPTNIGTGLRVSVMIHLPALAYSKQVDKVLNSLSRINYAVRGLFGEGSVAIGDFFQISNQITLGKSEPEMITEMKNIIPQIVTFERSWRQKLLHDERQKLEDRIWRAAGILGNARMIASDEALDMLSYLRLGCNLKIIETIPMDALNELFIFAQPCHLQKLEKRELGPNERDAVRADFIRKRLQSLL